MTKLEDALTAHQLGNIKAAEEKYLDYLVDNPTDFKANHLLGYLYVNDNKLELGEHYLKFAKQYAPKDPQINVDLAICYRLQERPKLALQAVNSALKVNPVKRDALLIMGNVLGDLHRPHEALKYYQKLQSLDAHYPGLKFNLGTTYLSLGNTSRAVELFEECLNAGIENSDLLLNYANAQFLSGESLEKTVEICKKAVERDPTSFDANFGLSKIYKMQRRHAEALDVLLHAKSLRPKDPELLIELADALSQLDRADEAILELESVPEKHKHGSYYWSVYCDVQNRKGNKEKAYIAAKRAYKANPTEIYLAYLYWGLKQEVCDWHGVSNVRQELIDPVIKQSHCPHAQSPFVFQSLPVEIKPEEQVALASRFGQVFSRPQALLQEHNAHNRLRIGFVSPDIREHPVSHLLVQLLRYLDKSTTESYLYSIGPKDNSPIRYRVIGYADHYVDLNQYKDDVEAADVVRQDELDVVIDLCGYTAHCRPGIFSRRIAPAQASYLGYIGTMGVSYIDYIIGDKIATPLEHEDYFEEKIVQMPYCYQSTDSELIVNTRITRESIGLPVDKFLFCSLNNTYKYDPVMFDSWAHILKRSPNSVLWLYALNNEQRVRLRTEMKARGVSTDRLLFTGRMNKIDYLGALRLADVFLDTRLYNAGTTASDALFVGVPIITLTGKLFSSRMASSIIHYAGLPDLVAADAQAYEDIAVRLATNVDHYREVKQRVLEAKSSTLFDHKLFAKCFELACKKMSNYARAGVKKHVVVDAPASGAEGERGAFDVFAPNDVTFTKQMGIDLIEKLRNTGDEDSATYIEESMREAFADEEQPEHSNQ